MNSIFSKNKEKFFLILLSLLAIVNYGQILNRGGYADDFVFISYIQSKELLDAILDWPFNGRLTQSILIPTLFKLSMGGEPGQFDWWIIQGIGLICLVVILFLFDKIMKLLDTPWMVRICACLFFCLYPIKNSTILWPATIIGYVIAVTFFLFAVSVYYSKAKNGTDSLVSFLLVFVLFTIANLSIEQIVPLIIVAVFFRLMIWNTDLSWRFLHILLGISQALIFLAVNLFLDKSSDKIGQHLIADSSLIKNAISISNQSIYYFLKNPLQYFLDDYYWPHLIKSALQIEFFLSIALISGILFYFNKSLAEEPKQNNKALIWLFFGGIIWWFAAISPLMLINYYLPDRIFFIPLFGVSVSSSIALYFFIKKIPKLKNIILGALILTGTLFSLINLYSQNDFSTRWQNEKRVIDKLASLKNEIKDDMTIHLFNFPSYFGPSPGLEDYFTFNGIVNWLYPQYNLKGSALSDFVELIQLPADFKKTIAFPIRYSSKENDLLLIYNQKNEDISLLKSLTITDDASSFVVGPERDNNAIATLIKLNHIHETRDFSIEAPYALMLSQYDLTLLPLTMRAINASPSKTRINIHARLIKGNSIPFDKWVYPSKKDNSIFRTTFFLNESSRIESVSLIKSDQKILLLNFNQQDQN